MVVEVVFIQDRLLFLPRSPGAGDLALQARIKAAVFRIHAMLVCRPTCFLAGWFAKPDTRAPRFNMYVRCSYLLPCSIWKPRCVVRGLSCHALNQMTFVLKPALG